MLEYRLNNIPLLIDESTSFVLITRNPACFTDGLVDRAARGVDILVNDHNRAHLGNPERFEKLMQPNDRKFPNFAIYKDGVLQISGTLVIKTANGEKYSGWVQSNLGALCEEQQEKNITDMPWPENVTFNENASNDNNDHYGLNQIKNSSFWEGIGIEDYSKLTNSGTGETFQVVRSKLSNLFEKEYTSVVNIFSVSDIKEGCVISPFLFLRYAIEQSLRINNLYIERNDITNDPDYENSLLKNMAIYNNFNIVDAEFITSPTQIQEWNETLLKFVTRTINKVTEKTWGITNFSYANLLPRISYKEFLLGIENMLNYIFFFKPNGMVDIIDRNAILDNASIDLEKYFRGSWQIGDKKDVRLKFTSTYDKDDKLFSDNYEDLSDRWADYGDPVATFDNLTYLGTISELRLVRDENNIYEYKWRTITHDTAPQLNQDIEALGWELVSSGPQPFIYGDADQEEEIKTACSTIKYNKVSTPEVAQLGNLKSIKNTYNDFTFRLLAPSKSKTEQINWEGPNGLFEKRWKTWAQFWKERLEVEGKFDLPLNMISHMQNNITSKFRTAKGEFIIEEMQTEIGMNQIGETTIKGYKV